MALFGRNDAVHVNPPAGARRLTVRGSDWLWAVTAVFIIVFLVNALAALRPRHGERVFHHIFSFSLLVGTVCYFAMASDLGWLVVRTAENTAAATSYQIFWAKYVNWAVTWPSLVVALGLLSGLPWATMMYAVGLASIWTVAWLASAFTATTYKWGFFVFGAVAWLLLNGLMLTGGRSSAVRAGVGRDYSLLAGWLSLLWMLYAVAFGLSDGGNQISVTGSLIFFGILDMLALPAISLAFLGLAGRWDYASLGLHFTQDGRFGHGGDDMTDKNSVPEPGTAV